MTDPRWALVAGRIPAEDFVYAVRTTGIVCRVGCASRRPRPENVMYFDDVLAAQRAGFRPCRRCRPDTAHPQVEFAADVAAQAIQRLSEGESVGATAAALHVSERHLRRIVRAETGRSPREVATA